MRDTKRSYVHSTQVTHWPLLLIGLLGLGFLALGLESKAAKADQMTADAEINSFQETFWVGSGSNCTFNNLQDAIDSAGGLLEPVTRVNIRVAGSNYTSQRLTINLDNYLGNVTWHVEELHIIGGYTSCGGGLGPGNPRTTLNANGFQPFDRVFNILYQEDPQLERTVVLQNLNITGGRVEPNEGGFVHHGGGIAIAGQPGKLSVQLRNTRVHENQALRESSGGGIYVEATGPEAVDDPSNPLPLLWLDDDSSVENNLSEAQGGGIRCVNQHDAGVETFSTSHLQTGNTLIRGNSGLHGGGISMLGCRGTIRAGGPYFFNPMIEQVEFSGGIIDNIASNRGGGIHAAAGAFVQVHGVSNANWGGYPESAAWVYSNRAQRGGGLYAWDADTRIRLRDAWFEENEARETAGSGGLGGAIYLGGGADLFMQRWLITDGIDYSGCRMLREPLFGSPRRCSGMIRNQADGRGGALFVVNRASADILDTYILDNSGGANTGAISHASNSSTLGGTPYAYVAFSNVLVAGNSAPRDGIYSGPGGFHDIRYSTVAGNDLEASNASLMRAFSNDNQRPGLLSIIGSILHDANATPLTSGGDAAGAALIGCVMANGDLESIQTQPGGVGFFSEVDDPEFIDPENRDYRLAETSPAINYCDDSNSLLVPPVDYGMDLRSRDQVFPGAINEPPNPAPGRLYDLGAYVAFVDQLFSDRFETL